MIYPDRGYVGCFDMTDKESGKQKLAEYVETLKTAGHKRIIAPINGDTWHTYRLVSQSSGEPPFPLEPQNPLWYNEVYAEAGFTPLKKYFSGRFGLGSIEPMKNKGAIRIRPFTKDRAEEDLERIFWISLKGFEQNFLYNDISKDAFFALYQPLLASIDEELAVFAEIDGHTAGFMFSFPAMERLILKTIAVLPEYRSAGVGAALMNHVLVNGQSKGFQTAVAALMAEDNHSRAMVARYGCVPFREYTLYVLEV
jgi:GNAT superfamily N-acetyltransferase